MFCALTQALAQRCGFTQAECFTSRSARCTGISMMAKSGVSQHTLNQKARHSDTATNALYFDPHELALADASIALHCKPVGKSAFWFTRSSILLSINFSNSTKKTLQQMIQRRISLQTLIWS
jgi:hypothetical protein